MKVDDAIAKLLKARKRLKAEQGRIARRNARRAYLAAVRSVRQAVDDEYPVMRKPVTRRRKPNPKRAVRGKSIITREMHRQLLAAGVSPSQFVERGLKLDDSKITVFAPTWMLRAYHAGVDLKLIAEGVRSRKVRNRIRAIVRLGRVRMGRDKT
jgi:hypothetical protein